MIALLFSLVALAAPASVDGDIPVGRHKMIPDADPSFTFYIDVIEDGGIKAFVDPWVSRGPVDVRVVKTTFGYWISLTFIGNDGKDHRLKYDFYTYAWDPDTERWSREQSVWVDGQGWVRESLVCGVRKGP